MFIHPLIQMAETPIYSPLSGQLASMTGLLLNLTLLFFTFKYTPKQMKDYARIIRLHCAIDIVMNIEVFFSLNVSFSLLAILIKLIKNIYKCSVYVWEYHF
jgi:hypothetical protein